MEKNQIKLVESCLLQEIQKSLSRKNGLWVEVYLWVFLIGFVSKIRFFVAKQQLRTKDPAEILMT